MAVVVLDVVDDKAFELSLVPDDGAVEELAAQGPDPALRERVRDRCADRRLEDLHLFGSEDLVERVDEPAATVAYEGAGVGELVGVADEQVAGGLGGPSAGGVFGDAAEVDGWGGDVDEEQQVEPAQCDAVDGGEVAGHGGLGAQGLRPGHVGSVRCWVDARVFEDLPDGGRRDAMSEADQFAVDAPVAPRRILGGDLQDQSTQLGRGSGSSLWSVGCCLTRQFASRRHQLDALGGACTLG